MSDSTSGVWTTLAEFVPGCSGPWSFSCSRWWRPCSPAPDGPFPGGDRPRRPLPEDRRSELAVAVRLRGRASRLLGIVLFWGSCSPASPEP